MTGASTAAKEEEGGFERSMKYHCTGQEPLTEGFLSFSGPRL